jgi:EpsI family protein
VSRPARIGLVSVLLVLAAAYVYLHPPARLALSPGALARFPLQLAGWTGVDRSFDEVVYEELSADDTLARRYERGGDVVWFVIVFHQNERYGAHDPLVCYQSHGWSLVDQGTRTLTRESGDFEARWMVLRSGEEERLALYWWYTAGDLATGDRDQFMARMAGSGILSNVTFGAFIRVSTIVRNGDVGDALDLATGFAEQALAYLPGLFEVLDRGPEAGPVDGRRGGGGPSGGPQ